MTALAPTLEGFFTRRLMAERQASPATVVAYRDALRLFVRFAANACGCQPCVLDFAQLDAPLVGAFLDHIERERGDGVRTRRWANPAPWPAWCGASTTAASPSMTKRW
jgi:site-specific recombinase XerC